MLKTILVPVRGDGMARSVFGHAAVLARTHDARLVVAHCRAGAEDVMPFGGTLPRLARETMRAQVETLADEQERNIRAELSALADTFGIAREAEAADTAAGTPCVAFVEEPGRMADVVQHNGRLADLIVVPQPDRDRNLGTNTLIAGLFRTGRPVLMCPRGKEAPDDLGRRVAVAWDGSREAARAVALTLDIVGRADSVTVLAGGTGELHGPGADELIAYYAQRGIAAELRRFEARNPGAELIEHAEAAGANVLMMGAYGESHQREALFGGNTQAIVDRAQLPVILVH